MSLAKFKLAAEPVQEETTEPVIAPATRSKGLRNLLMLGAGAAPFAGMIGDPPKIHEGKGVDFKSLRDVQRAAKPGDVVLSSPLKKSFTNLAIGLGTGSPDVTHAAFVDDRGRLISTISGDSGAGPVVQSFENGRTYTILRPKRGGRLNPAELAKNYRRQHDLAEQMTRGMPKAEAAALRREFYTKLPGFLTTPLREVMKPTIPHVAGDSEKAVFEKFMKRPNPAGVHECVGGWCSLPGAMAFPKGVDVVSGKTPRHTAPTDFLKSKDLYAVGGYRRNNNRAVDRAIRAGPTAARLTYGALGAAGVYGLDKLLHRVKKPKDDAPPASVP